MASQVRNIAAGKKDLEINVVLTSDLELKEVVVTGIYKRDLGSYTGSASTVKGEDLRAMSNQDLFQSLKILAPSIYIADNLQLGSDPNAIPSISMRGISSFPDQDAMGFKSRFRNDPNQPLFILDGFETSAETILDLDMNRIESLTILKDASAKALYGSKAANGVIVIETKKVKGNKQRVSYSGSLNAEIPDLTSYNLTNSIEKLEVEILEGLYDSSNVDEQLRLKRLFDDFYCPIKV